MTTDKLDGKVQEADKDKHYVACANDVTDKRTNWIYYSGYCESQKIMILHEARNDDDTMSDVIAYMLFSIINIQKHTYV